jgi:small subunit ribosomal protein S3
VGQKVHPYGFRIGFNKTWKSRWFANKDYATLLHEDLALKKDLKKRFQHAGVSMIEIERGISRSISTPRGPASSSAARARKWTS